MEGASEKTILLVEDNEDDVFLMKRALKEAEITNPLQIVGDGEQAIKYLAGEGPFSDRKAHPFPAIVFLDLKLPYLSGLEVLRWKQSASNLPPAIVIVVTSSSEPVDLNTAYKLGASSYIVKPPTSKQLVDAMKAFRLYWLAHNRFPIVTP